MSAQIVDVDNFTRVETDTMIERMLPIIGGVGVFHHDRALPPLDQQPVIRQNRDTLYSVAIIDLSAGPVTLTLPEVGDRYLSVMIINQDHYINRVFHRAGTYSLTMEDFDTPHVIAAARILFDPARPTDLEAVNRIQDQIILSASGVQAFSHPEYDHESYIQVREALLVLGKTMGGLARCFGAKEHVDPVRHLVGTALGWGGLPDAEASYINIDPKLPVGRYSMTFRDVPADAFWSVSVYNAAGYFEPGPTGTTNVNSVFAARNDDGSTTVRLGDDRDGALNAIPLPEGWNLLIRLYRPRLDELASWKVPEIIAA
ncbi:MULTISPECIES: DUF1254 domain-containing protein [unclassified Microbacterium]|uniref:DUF1254 domain-containing protein n=1 Tax=unclassified Microbacterium TaxID=2609290 RepID=UPI0016053728|nr:MULTISPECIES: DUF1254 domain-containing protein [unclassified Microbacterium]QNA92687.1 DUF1254 domain-containing protein [Microbacterium sp. Se63.02b]QYM62820.1 DUF1254 domain-containing protein [Microbacterium sp. Se5.02b]